MYIATYIIDIAALIYLIALLYSSTALNANRKKPFLMSIILTIIIILSEAVTVYTNTESASLRSINIVSNILGFALTPMIPIVITLIFDRKLFRTRKFLLIPTLINIIATVLSPLFRFVFYVDANNHYIRGDYFLIFITVYFINFLILVISTLKAGKRYNYPLRYKLIALSFFTILGTSIQLVYPSAYSSWHCVTLSLFLYFLLMSEFDYCFDTLTGLYNRAAFDKATKHLPDTKKFSVIILDINDFKSVNDTYGHDYGDTVIKTVAVIIRESFNRHYTCYRFGGDEFAIIGDETDKEKIENQLRAMTKKLSEMREKDNHLPTISYGYSIFREGEKLDFHKILKEADDLMYHFKKIHKTEAAQAKTSVSSSK